MHPKSLSRNLREAGQPVCSFGERGKPEVVHSSVDVAGPHVGPYLPRAGPAAGQPVFREGKASAN